MGFWLLMAMLACALVAIVVSLTLEPPPDGRWQLRRLEGTGRWLAVVPERRDRGGTGWADRLAGLMPPSVEPHIVPQPGATLAELAPAIREIVAQRAPDVLLVWTALDDVLAGVSLPEYELTLNTLLSDLDARGVTGVIGNVPDLARLPGAIGAGLAEPELRHLTDRWNGAIARLAHHHRALVADLRDLAPEPVLVANLDADRAEGGDTATPAAIAERFLPLLQHALVETRSHRLASSATESL